MFNIGEILNIDTVMDVTTQTIKKGDRRTCLCFPFVIHYYGYAKDINRHHEILIGFEYYNDLKA